MEPPSLPLQIISFNPFTMGDIYSSLVLLILLLLSAILSGSEAAYFSLTPKKIQGLKKRNTDAARRVLQLLQQPHDFRASIFLCNTLVNVAFILLTNAFMNSLVNCNDYPKLFFASQLIIITLILLIFAEIIPKYWAVRNSISFVCHISTLLSFINIISKPFNILLAKVLKVIYKRGEGDRLDEHSERLSKAALNDVNQVDEGKKMMKSIVGSTNIEVSEIMCPRIDVSALEINESFETVCKKVIEWSYSRLPVYQESLDEVKGILYVKDLLPFMKENADFNWQQLIRETYFIPENKKINDLIDEFQIKKMHMAIVVDEYGGTSGIITFEDILEEIVGEILDESDKEEDENFFVQLDDSNYIFEGKVLLIDFCKTMEISSDFFDSIKGESETLAGLILELKGYFPKRGEETEFKQFLFKIESTDLRRIIKIKVTVNN